MKKIFTSILVCLLAVFMTLPNVNALDTNKITTAYQNVVQYYQNKSRLDDNYWSDEIIAVESLGLEAEKIYDIPDIEKAINEEGNISSGKLSKYILASLLVDQDPNKIKLNGISLVENLESYIENGKVKGDDQSSNVVWVLFALEALSSENVDAVATELAKNKNDDKGYWSYDYYNSKNKVSSPDITGWVIEALSIANKKESAKETIDEYLASIQDSQDAHWKDLWGSPANADTQSCVLEGLIVYNKEDVDNDKYDQNGVSPFHPIIESQRSDGSFEAYYAPGESNVYTTIEAARCLGTYKNGSVILKAQSAYQDILKNQEENKTPTPPKQPTNTKPNTSNETNKTQKPTSTNNSVNAKVVETSDNNNIIPYLSILVLSTGLLLINKKKNEKYN